MTFPEFLTLEAHAASPPGDVFKVLSSAFAVAGDPVALSLLGPGLGEQADDPEALLRRAEQHPAASLAARYADSSSVAVHHHAGGGSAVHVDVTCFGLGEEAVGDRLAAAIELLRVLGRDHGLQSGSVFRQGGGAEVLPRLPVVCTGSHAVWTRDAALAEAFDDPAVVAEAFDEADRLGDGRLLIRGCRALRGSAFLAAVQEGHWAMARAARAGLTEYRPASPLGDEQKIFQAGSRLLLRAHFDTEHQRLEMTAAGRPGRHVRPFEVLEIRQWLEDRRLDDGRPVAEVRVIFADQETARAERRPLLDVGARVAFIDGQSGEMVELTA